MTLYESIAKLKGLYLNTPEDILHVPIVPADDPMQRGVFNKILENLAGRLATKQTQVAIRIPELVRRKIHALSSTELLEFHQSNHFQQEFIVFKFPNKKILVHGFCLIGPHWSKFMFDDIQGEFKVYWGEGIDTDGKLGTRPDLCNAVRTVNETLSPKKLSLDGAIVEFTIHEGGTGLNYKPVVFWGYQGSGPTSR